MNYMVNLNFIYLHVTLTVGFKANVYKDNKVLFYEWAHIKNVDQIH